MKLHALLVPLPLLLAGIVPDRAPPPAKLSAVLSDLHLDAIDEAAPPPAPEIRAAAGAVPADLAVEIRASSDSGWIVRARRKGHLVSIRTASQRAASACPM